jgi:cephalosporin-C deacetylase
MKRLFFYLIIVLPNFAAGQNPVTLKVTADQNDWVYQTGQPVKFIITVNGAGTDVAKDSLTYQIGPERMPATKTGKIQLKNGTYTVDGGTLKDPGFLRCIVTADVAGRRLKTLATAALSPERIDETVEMPADFSAFWTQGRNSAVQIPLDPQMKLLPERSTDKLNVYEVSINNFRGNAKVYGILCVPKKNGKYPAILKVPGAGIRPYYGDTALANKGFVVLDIGIHGIPVTLPPVVYTDLAGGALYDYPNINIVNRDQYYYKRVYLGCVRANDFLISLPEVDSTRLAVYGGSQGGALSIVTAALDNRVKYLASFYPALCDLTGYLHGRAGGWPHMFARSASSAPFLKERVYTTSYYDVANFSRLVKIPGFYAWGFNDETCPPTSFYAAYNNITAPKDLVVAKEMGHSLSPVQQKTAVDWLVSKLKAVGL